MSLDQINGYRSIVVRASTANDCITPIVLSSNDQDGRRLVFELWDGAEQVSGNGLTARLLFPGGYATMDAVEGSETATWCIDIPQEALTPPATRLSVEVSSGSQAVCTRAIAAIVEPALIDEDSPEAQDALSEFREAVARLEDFTVPVPISNGGTGATTTAAARSALGALSADGGTVSGSIELRSSSIDRDGPAPASYLQGRAVTLTDKDGERIGLIRADRSSTGAISLNIGAYNEADDTEIPNLLTLQAKEDGSASVSVTDGSAWRAGIGIGGLGTVVSDSQSTSVSIPSSTTATDLCSITLPAGTWVVCANALFAEASGGYRQIGIYPASKQSGISAQHMSATAYPVAGTVTKMAVSDIVTPSASTTYYLCLRQTSGSAVNAQGHLTALRII